MQRSPMNTATSAVPPVSLCRWFATALRLMHGSPTCQHMHFTGKKVAGPIQQPGQRCCWSRLAACAVHTSTRTQRPRCISHPGRSFFSLFLSFRCAAAGAGRPPPLQPQPRSLLAPQGQSAQPLAKRPVLSPMTQLPASTGPLPVPLVPPGALTALDGPVPLHDTPQLPPRLPRRLWQPKLLSPQMRPPPQAAPRLLESQRLLVRCCWLAGGVGQALAAGLRLVHQLPAGAQACGAGGHVPPF